MANSDKDIKITPNTGESAKPKIEVVGADNATKTITVNDDGSITFDSALTVSDLTVSGTTTTLNTATMTVEDKNIVLGSGNGTGEVVDATGITLEGGSGDDVTFQYNATDNRMELKHGSSFEDFKAGTVTGTFIGGLTGNVTGNASGTAATVTGAAQSAITSLGTLTTLTVDNVIINGTTIGHTDDTDLITLADGALTVAGTLQGSQIRIGGSANRIGNPATGELAIFTDSAERVRIDSSGNVGIGTSSPAKTLDVAGDIGLTGDIYVAENKKIYFDSTDSYIYADTDSSEDLHIGSDGHIELEPDNDLIVKAGSTEYVRFDGSEQKVGIGVSAPTDTLAVSGGIKIGEFNSTDGTGYAGSAAPSSANLGTGASDPQLRIAGRSSGQPGTIQMAQFDANNFFGGTSEFLLGKLQFAMNENSQEVTTVAEIRGITSDPQTAGHFDGALKFLTSQGDSSGASLTEKMILNSDGRVGIGTSSPDGPLHIYHTDNTGVPALKIETDAGDSPSDSILRIQESHGSDTFVDLTVNTFGELEISGGASTRRPILTADEPDTDTSGVISLNKSHYEWDTKIFGDSSTPVIFVDGTNNRMGVGTTSPTGVLHVTAADTSAEAFRVDITDSDSTADSTPFVVDGDGRVGIGTASPVGGYALTLNGDGTSYEGIAFQVGGSTKFKQSTDSTAFYFDSAINNGNVNFRVKDSGGNLRPTLGIEGDGFRVAVGYNGTSGSSLNPQNTLQVNVGTENGVQDKDDGILLLNSDLSIAANEMIGGIGFATRDGNIPSSVREAACAIVARAREDHTTTEKGGYLEFLYSPAGMDDDTVSSIGMTLIEGKLAVNNGGLHPLTTMTLYHSGSDFNDGLTIIRNDTSVSDGDLLGAIGFDAKDGLAPSRATEASAGIAAYAAEDHSTGDKGGDLVFFTSPIDQDDDTASVERMRIEANGGVQARKTVIKAVSSNTTLTDDDSGKTIYWTGGTLTLPATAEVGQQFVVINNTNASATPDLGTSNTIATNWTSHAAMADETARTYISVEANKWIYIG